MVITTMDVEKRLAELSDQRDQKIADANALTGAIQDCQHWLEVLAKDEPAAVKT